jgi:hypothetical protein
MIKPVRLAPLGQLADLRQQLTGELRGLEPAEPDRRFAFRGRAR